MEEMVFRGKRHVMAAIWLWLAYDILLCGLALLDGGISFYEVEAFQILVPLVLKAALSILLYHGWGRKLTLVWMGWSICFPPVIVSMGYIPWLRVPVLYDILAALWRLVQYPSLEKWLPMWVIQMIATPLLALPPFLLLLLSGPVRGYLGFRRATVSRKEGGHKCLNVLFGVSLLPFLAVFAISVYFAVKGFSLFFGPPEYGLGVFGGIFMLLVLFYWPVFLLCGTYFVFYIAWRVFKRRQRRRGLIRSEKEREREGWNVNKKS